MSISIGHLIGPPLTIGIATTEIKRPSLAKICVHGDLLKKLPHIIRLECGDRLLTFWQELEYEKLPRYCKHCMRLGHDLNDCKLDNPSSSNIHAKHETFVYIAKNKDKQEGKKDAVTEQGGDSNRTQHKTKQKGQTHILE